MKAIKSKSLLSTLLFLILSNSLIFSQSIGVSSGSISSINCGGTLPSFTYSNTPATQLSITDPTGCCPSFSWTLSSLSGPASVSVNSSTGQISVTGCNTTGTTGQVYLTFNYTDGNGNNQSTPLNNHSFTVLATSPVTYAYCNNATVCTGHSATLTASGGGASTYAYKWVNGATTQSINTSTAGTYSVTVTGNNGIAAIANGTVTIVSPPTVSVNNAATCSGTAATLTATTTNTTNYSWSPGGATTQTITVSPSSTTSYTVTASNAGCNATASGTVTVNASPTPSVNNPFICSGNSATLTATGGSSYVWSTSATTASISVSPSLTTTYIVTVSNANGCSATANGVVSVLKAAITPNGAPLYTYLPITCTGGSGSATVTASGPGGTSPYTYLWSTGSTSSSITVTATTMADNYYSVTVTDNNSCTSTASVSTQCVSGKELPASGPPLIENGLNIYPNPANHYLTLDYSEIEGTVNSIRILDLLGNELWKTTIYNQGGDQKFDINLDKLVSGVYICELSGDRIYRNKFVKE